MAKKETTKKTTVKKAAVKKAAVKKARTKKEVESIAENIDSKEIEVNPEVMEELNKVSEPKVDLAEQDPPLEVINGDPSVLGEVEEDIKEEYIVNPQITVVETETKPENPHEITSKVAEKIETEMQPEEYEAAKPAKPKNENKPKLSHVRRILGYFWNGMEMD